MTRIRDIAELDTLQPTDLIELSLGIENDIDAKGDLSSLPGKDSALFSISRHQTGYSLFFRRDLPHDVRHRIETLDAEIALNDHDNVRKILAQHIPCDSIFAGKGYYFARTPCSREFPDAVFRKGRYVVLAEGSPVAWAWTADESEHAAELAVETAPEFLKRGFARQAASAWAYHVFGQGKVAFYSHLIANTASEALARSLAVVQYDLRTTYERKSTAA